MVSNTDANRFHDVEAELRRQSQELAVAWRRGRAALVLDALSKETPQRSALLAMRIYQLLARWDPVECKWPVGFWRAVLVSSEGWITSEEILELETHYRRRFGVDPPKADQAEIWTGDSQEVKRRLEQRAHQLHGALEADEPIAPSAIPPPGQSEQFLRRRKEAP
jgi:hypothetical protein